MKATIRVEMSAGTRIDSAVFEAKRLASKLSVWIDFDFNGVSMLISQNADVNEALDLYHKELISKSKSKMVVL